MTLEHGRVEVGVWGMAGQTTSIVQDIRSGILRASARSTGHQHCLRSDSRSHKKICQPHYTDDGFAHTTESLVSTVSNHRTTRIHSTIIEQRCQAPPIIIYIYSCSVRRQVWYVDIKDQNRQVAVRQSVRNDRTDGHCTLVEPERIPPRPHRQPLSISTLEAGGKCTHMP